MRRSIATNYGPKVTWDQLQVGVRIYYTGDMANASANGTVVARTDGKNLASHGPASAPNRHFYFRSRPVHYHF